MEDDNFQLYISKMLNEKIFLMAAENKIEPLKPVNLKNWRATIKDVLAEDGHGDAIVTMTALSPTRVRVEIRVDNKVAIRQLDW